MTDNDRPQDVGRQHSKTWARQKREAGTAARALVDRYDETMRAELSDLLDMLAPVPQDQGLGMVEVPPKRPALSERTRIWDLAIKLGRELGSRIDPADPDTTSSTAGPRRPPQRRTVDVR